MQNSTPMVSGVVRSAVIPFVMAGLLLFALFGQALTGAYNIYSARALVFAVEVFFVVVWLVRGPSFYAWLSLRLWERFSLRVWFFASILSVFLAGYSFWGGVVRQAEWVVNILFIAALVDFFWGRGGFFSVAYFKSLLVAAVTVLAFFVWRWISMDEPRGFDWFWGAVPFLHIRHFAFLFLSAYVASLFFWEKNALFSLVSMVFASALMWAGGRGSIGAACLVTLLWVGYLILRQGKWRFFGVALAVWIVGWILSQIGWVDHNGLGLSILHGRDGALTADMVSSGRLSIWLGALGSLEGWRVLFGVGPDNYFMIPGRHDETVHPHSLYVQAFLDWGVVGALAFFVMLYSFAFSFVMKIVSMAKAYDECSSYVVIFLILLAQLTLGLVDGNFYHAWSVFMLCPVFVFLLMASTGDVVVDGDGGSQAGVRLGYSWLFGVAFLCALAMLQLVNVFTVFGRAAPEPNSWRAQLVMGVPFNALTVERWLPVWIEKSPVDAERLIRWLQVNSSYRYQFYLLEARMLRDSGAPDGVVRSLVEKALEVSPLRARAEIAKELE